MNNNIDNMTRNRLIINGYEHPVNDKTKNNNNIYKTLSENKNVGSTENKKLYANYNLNIDETYLCPICNMLCNFICQCTYNDKTCPNRHIWYVNRSGENVIGTPHREKNVK
jgi:hypothetical protein